MTEPAVAAVVLAAGRGSRLGSASKPLLPFADSTMIEQILCKLRAAAVKRLVVVTGFRADEVACRLGASDVEIVHNANFADGLSRSLQAGVRAAADAGGWLICLADMPLVAATTYRTMIEAFAKCGEQAILAPVYREQRGNPVLIGRGWYQALLALDGDRGARSLLTHYPESVQLLETDDPGVIQDIDTEADYRRWG